MKSKKIYNDAAKQVSEIFKVTPRYVYLVIEDEKKIRYKNEKADKIRKAYKQYLSGKTALIRSIEKLVKVA